MGETSTTVRGKDFLKIWIIWLEVKKSDGRAAWSFWLYLCSPVVVLRITRPINGFVLNLLIANKSQKRANIGVIWPLEFSIVFMLRNGKKIFKGQIRRLFSYTANQSPWGDHYLYYVIFFSIADVKARKNFPCINFVVSVDSYRQVKLWFVCIVVFYVFSFPCYVLTNQLEV